LPRRFCYVPSRKITVCGVDSGSRLAWERLQLEAFQMLYRPPYRLKQLDHPTRWEATRRHPVDLQLFEIFCAARGEGSSEAWSQIRRKPTFLDACNCVQILVRRSILALCILKLTARVLPNSPALPSRERRSRRWSAISAGRSSEPVQANGSEPRPVAQMSGDELKDSRLQMIDDGHNNQDILSALELVDEKTAAAMEYLRNRPDLSSNAN